MKFNPEITAVSLICFMILSGIGGLLWGSKLQCESLEGVYVPDMWIGKCRNISDIINQNSDVLVSPVSTFNYSWSGINGS